jgi:hypothetical protein
MKLIGVTGVKRSGKNTIGDYLEAKYGYKQLSFASKLKAVVNRYVGCVSNDESDRESKQTFNVAHRNITKAAMELGIANENLYEFRLRFLTVFAPHMVRYDDSHTTYSMTYRQVLQLFGTEVCRHFNDTIWLDFIEDTLLDNPDIKHVITDVRFDNEAYMVQNVGGRMICVERDGCDRGDHPSEQGVSDWFIDEVVYNDSDVVTLFAKIDKIMEG